MTINPMKYIATIPGYKYKYSFVESIAEGVKTVGRSGEFAIKKQKVTYIMAKKASDLFPELKDYTPRGWPKGMTWDDSPSVYHDGKIGCFSKPKNIDMPSTIRHETGHALDDGIKKIIGKKFTDTKGYIDVYARDLSNLEPKLSQYGLDIDDIAYGIQNSTPEKTTLGGRQETFAEIYAMLRGGSMRNECLVGIDSITDELFPNTVAYVKKLLWYLGDKK